MNVTYMMHQCLRLERMILEALVVTKKAVIVYVSLLQMLMELVVGFRIRAIIYTKSFRRRRVSFASKYIGFLNHFKNNITEYEASHMIEILFALEQICALEHFKKAIQMLGPLQAHYVNQIV